MLQQLELHVLQQLELQVLQQLGLHALQQLGLQVLQQLWLHVLSVVLSGGSQGQPHCCRSSLPPHHISSPSNAHHGTSATLQSKSALISTVYTWIRPNMLTKCSVATACTQPHSNESVCAERASMKDFAKDYIEIAQVVCERPILPWVRWLHV